MFISAIKADISLLEAVMYLVTHFFAALFLFIVMSTPSAAAGSKHSFSKSVQQSGTTYDVSSRSAVGSAVQIVTVTVRRGGKKISSLKTDADHLPQSVQAVDLTGDGTPELVMFSRSTGTAVAEALDVYWLDGTTLRRATAPELEEKDGYKGGDHFSLEDHLIVRTFPVYLAADSAEKPTGGTRSLKYEFKGGSFSLYVQTERAANLSDNDVKPSAPPPVQEQKETKKPAAAAIAALAITDVTATDSGIEIRTNGMVAKHRIVRLDKPERIAVDFPGGDSSLAGRKITINRFGISTTRIGRNKGFLRVVLDTTSGKFPPYEVKSSASGLLIEFTK